MEDTQALGRSVSADTASGSFDETKDFVEIPDDDQVEVNDEVKDEELAQKLQSRLNFVTLPPRPTEQELADFISINEDEANLSDERIAYILDLADRGAFITDVNDPRWMADTSLGYKDIDSDSEDDEEDDKADRVAVGETEKIDKVTVIDEETGEKVCVVM